MTGSIFGAGQRVVVTGFGMISCIGNDEAELAQAMRAGRSGLRFMPEYAAMGLRSQLAGVPDVGTEPAIDRKLRRFMADAAMYAHHAMRKTVDMARLPANLVRHPRTALVVGSGVGSPVQHFQGIDTLRQKGLDKVRPYHVPQIMGSTASANLALAFGVGGPSYTLSAACASSAHAIGNGFDLVRHGVVDRAFVGGAEETHWAVSAFFDAMGALSTGWNHDPSKASRPFDQGRDGFVIAGGAGMLLLESLASAQARGAPILAELAGYGASTAGADMVQPDAQGIARAMMTAMAMAPERKVDCISPHATSTPLGDPVELDAIGRVFSEAVPAITATKGLTGHSIGAIAAQEAILCLIMMRHGFIPACANLESPDPAFSAAPLVRSTQERCPTAMLSNSIGFGGTNASLLFAAM